MIRRLINKFKPKREVRMTKYLIMGTPKAISTLANRLEVIPEEYSSYALVPTDAVYMNQMGGWTSEQCDGIVYIVERNNLECRKNLMLVP